MKFDLAAKILLSISALFLITILIVASGLIDSLASDGEIEATVIGSLIIYWLLSCISIMVISNLRRRWRELLPTFLSTMLTLAVAEAMIRHFDLFPDKTMLKFRGVRSREYHHIYPTNKEMYDGMYEGKTVIIRTNEDGLRTNYSRQGFLKHRDRIVILGDSFVFGLGVRQEFTFPEVTEKLLGECLGRSDIAVLNAGIISYSPFLSNLLFSGKIRSYDPTVVLLFLDAGDIGDDIRYMEEAKQDDDSVYFHEKSENDAKYYGALYQLSRLYIMHPYEVLFNRSSKRKYNYYEFQLDIDNVIETNRFFIYRYPLEETRSYFLNTLENINRIAAKVSESGASFILVIIPRFHHWNLNECPKNWEKDQYSLNEPFQYEYFRFFEEIRDSLNYKILNLLPVFQETEEYPLVFERDPHWNERGHAFVAKVITNYLIENQLIE